MTANDNGDQPLLVVSELGRDYGGVPALQQLDLELEAGQALALVGHNGSGKTTALSMLAGRLEPTRGTIKLAGVNIFRPGGAATVRAAVSFVPDAPALYTDLTVADHLELVGMAHGVEDFENRVDGLLERFGLEQHRQGLPRELSRGMRQKTQIACALLRPFGVVMLDEPVAGLDPPSRRTLHSLLNEAKHEGAAVIFSTHYLEFARDLADQVLVLSDGLVATGGSYDEVVSSGRANELGFE